jgi:hypothetical protein
VCDHADTAAKTPITKCSIRLNIRTTGEQEGSCGSCANLLVGGQNQPYTWAAIIGRKESLRLTSWGQFRIAPARAAEIATSLLLKSADVTILSSICWTRDPI